MKRLSSREPQKAKVVAAPSVECVSVPYRGRGARGARKLSPNQCWERSCKLISPTLLFLRRAVRAVRPKTENSELEHVAVIDGASLATRGERETGVTPARREEIREFLSARFETSQDNDVKASLAQTTSVILADDARGHVHTVDIVCFF